MENSAQAEVQSFMDHPVFEAFQEMIHERIEMYRNDLESGVISQRVGVDANGNVISNERYFTEIESSLIRGSLRELRYFSSLKPALEEHLRIKEEELKNGAENN